MSQGYSEIVEVTQVSSNSVNTVNKMLAQGWKLLGIAHGHDEGGYPLSLYSLGRPFNVEKFDPTQR